MSESMLIFAIGPVQGFIEEARRTHDLWAGSRILVEVIRAAAIAAHLNGAELIFPTKEDLDADGLPNRLVAYLSDGVDPRTIANMAGERARDKWNEYAANARGRLEDRVKGDSVWEDIWLRQADRHLEIYWAACPPPSLEQIKRLGIRAKTDYGKWYAFTANALNARKQTRDFAAAEEDKLKDTLSGMRSALRTADLDAKEYWKQVADELFNQNLGTLLRPEGRERLDAIGAIKRFVEPRLLKRKNEPARFPSVSSIAAADFRRQVKKVGRAGQVALEAHADGLRALGLFPPGDGFDNPDLAKWDFDGDTLYKESFTADRLYDDYGVRITSTDRLKPAQAGLKQLYTVVRAGLAKMDDVARATPSAYYAVLMLDGDHMHTHVSACQDPAEHRELGKRLVQFARRTIEIIEANHAGRVIYAGGDDLLAFLPLADTLPVAGALANAYREKFQDWQQKDEDGNPFPFTVSAGIALAHHQAPLDAVLRAARDAGKTSKYQYGRDALCITALRRSGEEVRVGAKWNFGSVDTVAIFEQLGERFAKDVISSKFGYDLHSEARALTDSPEAYAAEVKRLLKRHRDSEKMSRSDGDTLAQQLATLARPLEPAAPRAPAPDERQRGPGARGKWVLLTRFIAQGGSE